MPQNKSRDPRTREAVEAFSVIGLFAVLHLIILLISFADSGFVFGAYFSIACVFLPVLTIVVAILLHRMLSWHQGQIALLLVASGVMSFLQLMLLGQATSV